MARALPIFDDSCDLDDISVASPCPASWDDMVGSDKVRFCGSCQKNVYNLSGMQRNAAVELLRATEGRVCVRFYRRADGTVLTEDCPVGLRAALRKARRMTLTASAMALGAVAAMLATLGGSFTRRTCNVIEGAARSIHTSVIEEPAIAGGLAPPPQDPGWIEGPPPVLPDVKGEVIMGEAPVPSPKEIRGRAAMPKAKTPTMGKPAPRERFLMGDVAPSKEMLGNVAPVVEVLGVR